MSSAEVRLGKDEKPFDAGKKASSATIIYLMLSLLPTGLKFFLLPVYIAHLSPIDYGILALLTVFGAFYGIIGILQLNISATVDFFKVENKRVYESSIISASIIIGLITASLFLIFGPAIFSMLFDSETLSFYPLGLMVLFSSLMGLIYNLFFVFFRNKYRMKELSFYSILLVITSTLFQLLFIVYLDLGVAGYVYGSFIANLLVVGMLLIKYRELLTFNVDLVLVKNAIKLSFPMNFTVFLMWMQQSGDRVFLEMYFSLEVVGQYSVLMSILGFALVINQAYGMAIRPVLFTALKAPNANRESLEKLSSRFVLISILSASLILLVGSNLDLITSNEKYLQIKPIFLFGMLAILPKILVKIPRLQLFYIGETRLVTLYTFISTFLMVGLIPLFISYGIKGVILAVGIAHFVEFVLFYYSFFRSKVPHQPIHCLKLLLFSIFGVFLIYLLAGFLLFDLNVFGIGQFIFIGILILLLLDRSDVAFVKKLLIFRKA